MTQSVRTAADASNDDSDSDTWDDAAILIPAVSLAAMRMVTVTLKDFRPDQAGPDEHW